MLMVIATMQPWRGEPVRDPTKKRDVTLPRNCEDLWSDAELKVFGLARVVLAENAEAPTKLHRRSGSTLELVGDVAIETPTYELPSREEVISMLAARAWALFGEAFFLKNTLNDWTGYRASLKTRGVEILAAFDEGGHDIDVHAGSIDGQGGWPDPS